MFANMLTNIINWLMDIIGGVLNIVWAIICVPVYGIIRNHFNVFIRIAELNILSVDSMNEIYKRITMIITVVMSFYVVFSIVKYTIDPDSIGDKQKGAGNIAKRMIIAIILIAFVPTIFSTAQKLQNRIISTQVIPKVILGQEIIDFKSYGSSFAADTFSAFYRVDWQHCGNKCDAAQEKVNKVINSIRENGTTVYVLRAIWDQTDENIEFDGLFALLFGGFVIYVIFLYSIDVAVRYIQLLYLQVISPIAIMGYIVPGKDNLFQKWLKQAITTYLDLFIRISIMYFAMLIIQILGHSLRITNMTTGTEGNHIGPIAYIFFIMGVLIFVQRAPKLLAELFPSSGAAGIGMGFEWKTRGEPLKKSLDTIKKPIAATAGAVASTVSTAKSLKSGRLKAALDSRKDLKGWGRFREGALAVGKSAWLGGKDAAKSNSIMGAFSNRNNQERAAANKLNEGGTQWGHDVKGLRYEAEKERFKTFLDGLESVVKSKKTVSDANAELKTNKAVQSLIADWNEQGIGDPTKRAAVGKDIEKFMRLYAAGQMSSADVELNIKDTMAKYEIYGSGTNYSNNNSVKAAVDGIMAQFAKDQGSTELKILGKEIAEAQKIAISTKNADGTPHVFEVEHNGTTYNLTAMAASIETMPPGPAKDAAQAQLEALFAEHIGDIEKDAANLIVDTKYSTEYKEAMANANAPGKKE